MTVVSLEVPLFTSGNVLLCESVGLEGTFYFHSKKVRKLYFYVKLFL